MTDRGPERLQIPEVFEAIAANLVRAVRGRRSQSDFSRRIGYRSNIARRWEVGSCFPTASDFLRATLRVHPETRHCFEVFFKRVPDWFEPRDPFSAPAVAAFMRELRGKTPIGDLATLSGENRYSVGRWLQGRTEPKLPQFLRFIEVTSRRLLDFIASITDPTRMATVSHRWLALQQSRRIAYESPWSHAVLRALELAGQPRGSREAECWLAGKLGLSVDDVRRELEVLAGVGQIKKTRGKWRIERILSVDTSQDVPRSRALRAAWTAVAVERLTAGAPGSYGFSVFAVSRKDLRRLRAVHLEYVRAMQAVIAASEPAECVGLYCVQLLDLNPTDSALEAGL